MNKNQALPPSLPARDAGISFPAGSTRRNKQYNSVRRIYCTLAFGVLLSISGTPCFSQRTVVSDAGAGTKVELVYNAADQVVETRTLDAAGSLEVRAQTDYRPGFLVPQHKTTNYWPGGKAIKSVDDVSFDENGNFTGEVVAEFDQAGKHSGGTKLSHDPLTGVYQCSRWDVAAQGYQRTECPATEGSGESAESAKELTADEVSRELALARQARREELEAKPPQRQSPAPPGVPLTKRLAGVILPARLHPGARVSGSIVEGCPDNSGTEDLTVICLELPLPPKGEDFSLADLMFETPGEAPQRANGPVTFTVPSGKREFTITLRQAGDAQRAASRSVNIEAGSTGKGSPKPTPRRRSDFQTAALCQKGDLCAVRGAFSGDSSKTLIAFGGRPAAIVAETESVAYIRVPPEVQEGLNDLIVSESPFRNAAVLPVVVSEVSFSPEKEDVGEGQFVLVHAMLVGPEALPDDEWKAGTFEPTASAEKARRLAPGFELPRESAEGTVLLVFWNASPEGVSLRTSIHQTYAFRLTHDSFDHGEFRYQFVVDGKPAGRFDLRGTIVPFLAPVHGRSYVVN